jgi:phosphoesterase RecJ-like protein
MIALAALLRAQGKRATLYSSDLVPRHLKWLPLLKTWVHKLRSDATYDLTIVLDAGDAKLLGDAFPGKDVTGEVVALDHHASAVPFGDLFVSDPEAASTGVLVARLARLAGWPLDADSALGLYVSISADTGSFRYSNTNAEVFRLAANLVEEYGVDPWRVTEHMYEQVPVRRYRLLQRALESLELLLDGRVALMVVTAEDVAQTKAAWEDTEGLVNYARSLAGVECGLLLTPAKTGGTRVSLRSKGKIVDAGAVCLALGGGGHRGAAGCTLPTPLPEARTVLLEALTAALEE